MKKKTLKIIVTVYAFLTVTAGLIGLGCSMLNRIIEHPLSNLKFTSDLFVTIFFFMVLTAMGYLVVFCIYKLVEACCEQSKDD